MDEQSKALAQRMSEFVPHAAALGLTIERVGDGRGVMSVAWREDLVGDPETGVIASGVVTALHAEDGASLRRGQRLVTVEVPA